MDSSGRDIRGNDAGHNADGPVLGTVRITPKNGVTIKGIRKLWCPVCKRGALFPFLHFVVHTLDALKNGSS